MYNSYDELYSDVYLVRDELKKCNQNNYSDDINKALRGGFSPSEIYPPLLSSLKSIPNDIANELRLIDVISKLIDVLTEELKK